MTTVRNPPTNKLHHYAPIYGAEGSGDMKVTLKLDGRTEVNGTPLVMHHERLADPLDFFQQELSKISKKRGKTDEDHREVARLEFYGGLYTEPEIEDLATLDGQVPGLPAWNILRCLQDGAKRHRRGTDVPILFPLTQFAPITFLGEEQHPEEMWKSGRYALRKTVGIQRSRVMRTRPIFREWGAQLEIEVDSTIWNARDLAVCWKDAGMYKGIGEMRPVYGRFAGTVIMDGKVVTL